MKNPIILAVLIITVLSHLTLFSQESGLKKKFNDDGLFIKRSNSLFQSLQVSNKTLTPGQELILASRMDSTQPVTGEPIEKHSPNEKSVVLGTLFSAVIPGAGEFYAKSYVKAAIFFGVEAITWGIYGYYQHKGGKQTDYFQSYADQNWSIKTYGQWLKDHNFKSSESINTNINESDPNQWEILKTQINQCEDANGFSHTLPDNHTQQFYELIGKYQEYQTGWKNLTHPIDNTIGSPYYFETYHDPIFVAYSASRQLANTYYNDATTAAWVILANHILSAGDAAWSVSMFNKKINVQTGFRIGTFYAPFTYQVKTQPEFKLRLTF